MEKYSRIYVAGHRGLAGSAILRHLLEAGYANLIIRTHTELDLCDQRTVAAFFAAEKPEYVFLAAGRVGGIQANIENPAPFLYDNLAIQMNVIHQAYLCGSVKKMLILGSSCIFCDLKTFSSSSLSSCRNHYISCTSCRNHCPLLPEV